MAYATVTLSGTYQTPDGTPHKGHVEIIPSERVIKDTTGDVILTGRVKIDLDAQGAFTVALPATDDPTLNPTGFGYTIAAKLHSSHPPAVSFSLPAALGATTVEDLTPVDPSTFAPTTTYAEKSELDAVAATIPSTAADVNALPDSAVIPSTPSDIGAEPAGLSQATSDTLAATYTTKAQAATKAPGGSLYLPGIGGNYVSTDDAPGLAITGDLDVRVHAALPSWAPGGTRVFAGQYNGANADSWRLDINSSGGLIFRHYPGGVTGAGVATTSSSVVPFSAGELKWIRVTLDVDNGAGGNDIRFYYSDDGETWTQLGNTLTAAGTATLYNSPERVILGASTTAGNAAITGELREVQIRDGIDGLIVANYKSDVPVLRYRDTVGNLWVVAGSSWSFLGKG